MKGSSIIIYLILLYLLSRRNRTGSSQENLNDMDASGNSTSGPRTTVSSPPDADVSVMTPLRPSGEEVEGETLART